MCRLTCFFISSIFILSAKSYRLPTSVNPSYYKIQILTYLGVPNNFNYSGKTWIQVNCNEQTQNITLHAKDLNITTDAVTIKDISGVQSKNVKVKNIDLVSANDFLIINVEEPLRVSHKYEVYIPFEAELTEGLKGFYRSSYTDEKTKEKRWLGVTQFEAISARQAFPCFDEPAMKAIFEIILGRKEGYSSVSNMPLASTEPIKEKEGWFWDKYEPSVPMSTYLVAFLVSDFGYRVSEPSLTNNVTFKIWAKKDALDQVEYSREFGPRALEYFEQFFDVKYPLPKQDMVAIPDFSAGAMENWGLITYREALLLFDPKISSLANQQSIAGVIAHELAHQWFGNLVTMKWWTDLWLNEGFATYMSTRAVDYLYPEWHYSEESAVMDILSVFSFDALRTSHPVSVPIGHPNEINEIFDTISYKKGSFLIRMMSLFLGDATLRKGVSNYLKKHKYGNAEQDDLWESLTEEAHKAGVFPQNLTVKTVMDTWTVQTGYPLVTVTRDYKRNTAEVKQQRFIKDEVRSKSDYGCWWVPLTYTNGKDLDFVSAKPRSWLSCDADTITIDNLPDEKTWIVFNIQIGGLYKVNYDDKNWKLLSQALNSQNYTLVPTLNRVQLLDDAFDLAWTGDLKYDVVFDLARYLKFEDEYLPWKVALGNINSLNRQLKKSSTYGYFKSFMRIILRSIYNKVGGLHLSEDRSCSFQNVKHQVSIANFACRFDVANCISDAQELFRKFRKNPNEKNIIPKDLKNVIYCTSVRHGGEKEWEFLWDQYTRSNVATEKRTILNALGCTREIWLLRRYLEWSINEESGIRRQDSSTVFSVVASNDIGFYVAKNFLYTKIKDIYKHLSQNARRISGYLSSIAAETTSAEDYKELQDFMKANPSYLKYVKQGVEQSLETAKLNVQWQQHNSKEVERLLKKYINEKPTA